MLLYLHTLGTSVVKREIEYSDCQGLVQDRLLVDYNSSVHIYICILYQCECKNNYII